MPGMLSNAIYNDEKYEVEDIVSWKLRFENWFLVSKPDTFKLVVLTFASKSNFEVRKNAWSPIPPEATKTYSRGWSSRNLDPFSWLIRASFDSRLKKEERNKCLKTHSFYDYKDPFLWKNAWRKKSLQMSGWSREWMRSERNGNQPETREGKKINKKNKYASYRICVYLYGIVAHE